MSKNSKLSQLIAEELPKLSYQKRLRYRTNYKEVLSLFKLINHEIFNDKLPIPKIQVQARCRKYWGICIAEDWDPFYNGKK